MDKLKLRKNQRMEYASLPVIANNVVICLDPTPESGEAKFIYSLQRSHSHVTSLFYNESKEA